MARVREFHSQLDNPGSRATAIRQRRKASNEGYPSRLPKQLNLGAPVSNVSNWLSGLAKWSIFPPNHVISLPLFNYEVRDAAPDTFQLLYRLSILCLWFIHYSSIK